MGLVRLAALVADTATASIMLDGRRFAVGLDRAEWPDGTETQATVSTKSGASGLVEVMRADLSADQLAGLAQLGLVVAEAWDQEQDRLRLQAAAAFSARADRILTVVSDARSCAEGLTGLLEELCRHTGALVGRIWRMFPNGTMDEVSRYNAEELAAHSYYRQPTSEPVRGGNSHTAAAIVANEPLIIFYDRVANPEKYVLLKHAVAAGLQSQVSFPFWVQDQRFGLSLAFTSVRDDLDSIVADVAALENIIRPALLRKVTEERIRHLAHHDQLTQLGNRTVFHERLQAELDAAGKSGTTVSLLYLDLDGFKQVNDTRGHEVGDQLLTAVSHRLRDSVRDCDLVARLGGDEFAVIQPGACKREAGSALANRLIERVDQPFLIAGQACGVGVSIGLATFPMDGTTPDALLRNADAALYQAKESGRGTFRLFEPALVARHRERNLRQQDLRDAVSSAAFRLAFQPICETDGLLMVGREALLRWTHPVRGPQSPSDFIPIAEESGLIVPLGQWALEAACTTAARWTDPVSVSVNLSPMQFRQPRLAEMVLETLAVSGLSASRLDLEVTEGLLLDDSSAVMHTMRRLREAGVRLTLDDFGTGYASLSLLRRYSFDRIKIDRSFVHGMCGDSSTRAIVQAVLDLSARLGLEVVAEGVETQAELNLLRELGCRLVQGYLIGKPAELEPSGLVGDTKG